MLYWVSCFGNFLSGLVIVRCMVDICRSIYYISGDILNIILEECGLVAVDFLPENLENDALFVDVVGDDVPDN